MACSEWSLSHSLWKKVRQLEKSTPAVLVVLVTNYSHGHTTNCLKLTEGKEEILWQDEGFCSTICTNLFSVFCCSESVSYNVVYRADS